MTAELYGQAPPNPQAFILAHLLPLSDGDTDKLGAKRWQAGMPVPYRMVCIIPGPSDLVAAYCKVRLHTFHTDYTDCSHAADVGHRRMLVLADDPLFDVPMADGATANCTALDVTEEPHEEPYAAESVVTRFVSEYDMILGFTPVTT